MVRVILCMITGNESKIIRRCLDSVRSFISGISICVNGKDDTHEIIDRTIQEFGVPGQVVRCKWRNFAQNRSESFLEARKFAEVMGWPLRQTYALLLDADMIFRPKPAFHANLPKYGADAYKIFQFTGPSRYPNIRLLRLDLNWECVCFTHEFWDTVEGKHKVEDLADCDINDVDDGGTKEDKFPRDYRLCREGIEKDKPKYRSRYYFYLGNTCRTLGDINRRKAKKAQQEADTLKAKVLANPADATLKASWSSKLTEILNLRKESDRYYEEARQAYQKRIELGAGNNYSEVWFSYFRIGLTYKCQHKYPEALFWYLKAQNHNAHRADAYYSIARIYRKLGDFGVAFEFCKQAYAIPYPRFETLFVESDVYSYLITLEMAKTGHSRPEQREDGYLAAEEILLRRDTPHWCKEKAALCRNRYIEPLVKDHPKVVTLDFPRPKADNGQDYYTLNPSILKVEDGYLINYRTVNYAHKDGAYPSMDRDGKIRTRNFLLRTDYQYVLKSSYEIVNPIEYQRYGNYVLGMEDCRLFQAQGRTWFLCTTLDTNPTYQAQMTLCRLAKKPKDRLTIEIDLFRPLQGPNMARREKNWLPFTDSEDNICVLYSYDPLVIYKVNVADGSLTETVRKEVPLDLGRFRGSAGPLPFKIAGKVPGWLVLIHEVAGEYAERRYRHRLLWFDKDWQLQRMSKLFSFRDQPVEFCLSMVADFKGSVFFGVGIDDKISQVYGYLASYLEEKLFLLPEYPSRVPE